MRNLVIAVALVSAALVAACRDRAADDKHRRLEALLNSRVPKG